MNITQEADEAAINTSTDKTNEELSGLEALMAAANAVQEEKGIVACNLDAPEGCETCSG